MNEMRIKGDITLNCNIDSIINQETYVPHRPPSNSQTGRPATFPRISQHATSKMKENERRGKEKKGNEKER